jgi:acyl-CoA synthetase (AMP-forming)/AMP-acid ligase II
MGLIGNLLQAVYKGYCCVLMSPLDFLKRPASWLRAITRYRATVSGAPSFAYELCTRRLAEAEREGLDLGSWEVAFSGAEPVRAETLDRFAAAFAPHGFRRAAFYPCYGLAEATLMVTGVVQGRAPSVLAVDREALARGRAEETPPDASGAQRLVGCGIAWEGHEVRIVDADTCRPLGEDAVGEIWVRGPSVAQGYWERPALSAAQFGARLDGSAGAFLRTGDLGFVHGGELFVAGRIKDVIVLKGRTIHPHDVERIADDAHAAVRRGCGAAFAVEADAEERLALVQEVDPGRAADLGAVMDAIRRAVSRELSVQTWALLLVPPGSVPKTSSGKVRRSTCRQRFLEDGFETIAAWRAGPS